MLCMGAGAQHTSLPKPVSRLAGLLQELRVAPSSPVDEVGAAQLLAEALMPCLYRAPTDNDRGGSGGTSYAAR